MSWIQAAILMKGLVATTAVEQVPALFSSGMHDFVGEGMRSQHWRPQASRLRAGSCLIAEAFQSACAGQSRMQQRRPEPLAELVPLSLGWGTCRQDVSCVHRLSEPADRNAAGLAWDMPRNTCCTMAPSRSVHAQACWQCASVAVVAARHSNIELLSDRVLPTDVPQPQQEQTGPEPPRVRQRCVSRGTE